MKTAHPSSHRRSVMVALSVASAVFICQKASAQIAVDSTSRENARAFYNGVYPASENVAAGWAGNSATGNAGNTCAAFKDAVFLRINYFRAMAGLPADVTDNSTYSANSQQAALMMSANKNLSHNPPTNWRFYTAGGAEAAASSNLAYNFSGPTAISQYMQEPGTNNTEAGHRRWILYPQTQQMGTGDVMANGVYSATNSLWIIDLNHFSDLRPETRDSFVAWPPSGYVPYQVIYPRWSFSYPNADFSGATVSMARNGASVPVRLETPAQGYGENSIVFIPDNLNPNAWSGPVAPASDTTTTVTVNNVKIDGASQSFSYNVTSFDPAKIGADTPDFTVDGPATPTANVENHYTIADQAMATGYQWSYSQKTPYTTVDGAEFNGSVALSGFVARDRTVKSAGAYSYHLANPRFQQSSFSLKSSVFCNPSTVIYFNSRLTYATSSQFAKVEVSTDNGASWRPVYCQRGTGRAGEARFFRRAVSLAAYAGREVKVRFHYDLTAGSAFTQTSTGIGWYLDTIYFANAEKLVSTQYSAVTPSTDFAFTPGAGASYLIQVRPQILGKYFLSSSVAKAVTASR